MTTQNPTHAGPRYLLDKVLAVALIAWLFFFGGFSTLKTLLTPTRLSQAGQIADTIRTGAGRVIAPAAAPAARPAAVPAIPPRQPAAPAAQLPANQAAAEANADAAYQATVQAVNAAQPAAAAVAQPGALPTAVIAIPTAQAVVVPWAMPVLASNSPPTVTPIPTIAYPTPLPAAAAAYTVSPDGLCVIAPRAGKQYQVCQAWKYKPDEATSVADYIRTGLLPGTEVQ